MSVTASALGQSLSTDTFMKLFLTQMRHQDPTEPQSADQMLAQLAQLTSVEQLTQMGSNFGAMLRLEQWNAAQGMAGRTVQYTSSDGSTTSEGVASAAVMQNGAAGVMVGGQFVSLDNIVGVASPGGTA